MVYLLKMVIFHGELLNNQMVSLSINLSAEKNLSIADRSIHQSSDVSIYRILPPIHQSYLTIYP